MVIDHAFRPARSPRGVIERDRIRFGLGKRPDKVRIPLRNKFFILDLPEALAGAGVLRVVDIDHQWLFLELGQRRPGHGREYAVGNEDFRLGVLEYVGDRIGVEARVDGVEHRPQQRHAIVHLEHGWNVRQHRRYHVAPLYSRFL